MCVCVCVCTSSQSLTSFQNLIGFNFSRPTRLPRLIESFAHKVFISNVHLLIFSDLKGLRILIERYMFVFFSSQCCLSIQIVLALPTLSGGKQQVTCSRISMFITDRQAETPGRTLKMASVFSPPWLWVRDMTYARASSSHVCSGYVRLGASLLRCPLYTCKKVSCILRRCDVITLTTWLVCPPTE